jgi:hypothetical protein
MAAAKDQRLVIERWVPSYLAKRLSGLDGWFEEYAAENLPNEELAPGEDGLPADTAPELDEVKKVEQVRVVAANDIGEGHLSVKCEARLVVTASLNDPGRRSSRSAQRGRCASWSSRRLRRFWNTATVGRATTSRIESSPSQPLHLRGGPSRFLRAPGPCGPSRR